MRSLIVILMILPQLAVANICKQTSTLAKKHSSQNSWTSIEIGSPETPVKLKALEDEKGRIVLDNTIYRGPMEGKIQFGLSGTNLKYFKSYCLGEVDKDALSTWRRLKKNNSYHLQVQYLPDAKQMSDLYAKLETTDYEVIISYSSLSGVEQDYSSEQLKAEIQNHILEELQSSSTVASFNIDLTNYDDLVCDLIDGSAKLNLLRKMRSPKAVVEKEERLPAQEIQMLYNQWSDSIADSATGTDLAFVAGMGFQMLKDESQVKIVGMEDALAILKKAVDPVSARLMTFNSSEKQCLVDSMADYREADTRQLLNLEMTFDATKMFEEN